MLKNRGFSEFHLQHDRLRCSTDLLTNEMDLKNNKKEKKIKWLRTSGNDFKSINTPTHKTVDSREST